MTFKIGDHVRFPSGRAFLADRVMEWLEGDVVSISKPDPHGYWMQLLGVLVEGRGEVVYAFPEHTEKIEKAERMAPALRHNFQHSPFQHVVTCVYCGGQVPDRTIADFPNILDLLRREPCGSERTRHTTSGLPQGF